MPRSPRLSLVVREQQLQDREPSPRTARLHQLVPHTHPVPFISRLTVTVKAPFPAVSYLGQRLFPSVMTCHTRVMQ